VQGDFTIWGGNAVLEEGSRIEGDLNVLGGNADLAGTVTGDINVFGGDVQLRSSSRVEGNITKLGGNVSRAEGSVVQQGGTSVSPPVLPTPFMSGSTGDTQSNRSDSGFFGRLFGRLFGFVTSAIVTVFGLVFVTLIAFGFAALVPDNLVKSAAVAVSQWGISGIVGALTLVVVPILSAVLIATICLIPVAFILLLAYGIAILAGLAVSARIVGERLMVAVHRVGWTLVAQVVAGAILLALLGTVPVVGPIISFAAISLGLGALILSRFGTQDYPLVRSFVPATPLPPAMPPVASPYRTPGNPIAAPITPAAPVGPAAPSTPQERSPDDPYVPPPPPSPPAQPGSTRLPEDPSVAPPPAQPGRPDDEPKPYR